MKPGKPLRRKSPLLRTKRLRAKPARRVAARAALRPYVAWVRTLACISCGHEGPSDAAHMPVGPRGVGLKAPDTSVVPLCRACHLHTDGHTNRPMPRDMRRELAKCWVEKTQAAWAAVSQ